MTDWTGFTPAMNFIGLSNYAKLFTDSTFMQAMGNNILMAIVIPIVTLGLAMFFATLVTIGGSTRGNVKACATRASIELSRSSPTSSPPS